MSKFTKSIIILGFVSVLAIVWFFISPLFIDKAVDEALVFPSATAMPTRSDLQAMDEQQRANAIEKIMLKMAGEPELVVDEQMMTATSPIIIAHGKFSDADKIHRGSGNVTLYQIEDGSHVIRFEDFRVTNGPDLVVYLVKHSNPLNADDVKQGYLELAKLKGNVGNQNYSISAGTDISEYNSVAIWCDLFDVLFSPAVLVKP